jgi:hypothetical protein
MKPLNGFSMWTFWNLCKLLDTLKEIDTTGIKMNPSGVGINESMSVSERSLLSSYWMGVSKEENSF